MKFERLADREASTVRVFPRLARCCGSGQAQYTLGAPPLGEKSLPSGDSHFIGALAGGRAVLAENPWPRRVDTAAAWLFGIVGFFVAAEIVAQSKCLLGGCSGGVTLATLKRPLAPPDNIWTQFALPYLQLVIAYGLTYCPGDPEAGQQSYFATFLRTWPLKFLGKISYALYLVHEPLIYLFHYLLNGPIPNEEHPLHTPNSKYNRMRTGIGGIYGTAYMPVWGIPVVMSVSFVLAVLLERYVEAPCRDRLRAPRK